jgi:hypothetical protein
VDDPLVGFLQRWIDERRDSLRAGHPQDVAASEVVDALPELAGTLPLQLGLRMLAAALTLDDLPAPVSLMLDLGPVEPDATDSTIPVRPPGRWDVHPDPDQVQLYLVPPDAGTPHASVESWDVPLQWDRPPGIDRPVAITYTVLRRTEPELAHWEPTASLAITPLPG